MAGGLPVVGTAAGRRRVERRGSRADGAAAAGGRNHRQEPLSDEGERARECQTDATSCHRRQNGTSDGKSRYICLRDDKLDEAFEHLEIPDIPLEYEDEDDDYIDEDVPLGAGRRYASGASFEELDAAMKTARDPSADDSKRRQAGRLFGQMQGTEFFDRLVSGSSDIAEKITGLMDYYLSPPFLTAGNAEAAAAALPIATDAPDGLAGFDIRDFV